MNKKYLAKLKWLVLVFLVSLAVIHILARLDLFKGKPAENFGTLNSRLLPCDENAVCYVSRPPEEGPHYIHSILLKENWQQGSELIVKSLTEQGCSVVQVEGSNYIKLECTTMFFRTSDDLELYFSEIEGRLHVKTQARISWLDWGRQIRRIRGLRAEFGRSDDPPVGKNL